MKIVAVTTLTATLLCCGAADAKRDPFAPFGSANNGPTATASSTGKKALTTQPLMAYKLIGVVSSQEKARAIVTTSGGTSTFIIEPGERLGKEGGTVDRISLEGVAVKVGDDLVELTVSNKLIQQQGKGN